MRGLDGNDGLTTSGDGAIVLAGTNTYTGDTTLGGSITAEGGQAIPDDSPLEVKGTLALGDDETVAELYGNGTVDTGTFTLTFGTEWTT